MKKIIFFIVFLALLFPSFTVHGEADRWEHILSTEYFVYSFDKLSFKYTVAGDSGGKCLDLWFKYQYLEPAIAEMVARVREQNMANEDIEYTKNLDYMLIHVLLSQSDGKMELETIAYNKNGIPLRLDPASDEWLAIVPGSVNEYLFNKVWEYAAKYVELQITKTI